MNRIRTICYALMLLFVMPTARAQEALPIRFTLLNAEVGDDDSVTVNLRIQLQDIRVASSRSLVLLPCLESISDGKRLPLPPVVVSGRRRALYDDRRQAVSPSDTYVQPYARIVKPKKHHPYNIVYNVRVPYTTWMRNAGLILNQSVRDCCHSRPLSEVILTNNLGLVPPCVKDASAPSDRAARAFACYSRDIRFVIPEDEPRKLRTATGVSYIDYRQGSSRIDPRYGSNPWELADADSIFGQLRRLGVSSFRQISITGYASPEGAYYDNEKLAKRRSEGFRRYIEDRYNPKDCPIACTWVAEDWDELRTLLTDSNPSYKEQVFFIMDNYGIFEGREKYLSQLEGGTVYTDLLSNYFPRLRRVEIRVTYEMPPVSDAAAAGLLYTHPEQLSLAEMYRIARFYPPATEQHREVYLIAARTYPDNTAAQINAAAASLLLGDAATARRFLEQKEVMTDPRADACRNVMRQLLIDETISAPPPTPQSEEL